jgi:PAS domain S-box-containing protein
VPREVRASANELSSLQLFASIVELCDDAVISATIAGVIMSWNKSAERIFGYTAGEIIGQPLTRLLRFDAGTDLERNLARIRRGERIGCYETIRYCKDGKQIPVCITCSPVCDASKQVIGLSEIVRKISNKRRAERPKRTNERLMVMGRLASRIAHEINNPLTSVTNLLFLLQKEFLTTNAAEYVTVAQREVARIARISAQSLGIYRFSGPPALCSMATILDEAVEMCHDRIATMNIAVLREYRSTVPMIGCHREELRQVMLNIVGNALDAMPQGGRLRLRIRERKDLTMRRSGVLITVADTGTGMSSTTRSRLFEPFFTTKEATGTGLGLWACAHVLAKYGGRIQVKSTEAPARSGSVFTLFLPI